MSTLIRVQLRNRREALGMSQQALAGQLATVQSHVSDLEQGEVMPNLTTLERWAYALGFEVKLRDRAVLREPEETRDA